MFFKKPRWLYKLCPRCGGDLYLDHEEDSTSVHCLQCGFERVLVQSQPAASPLSAAAFGRTASAA